MELKVNIVTNGNTITIQDNSDYLSEDSSTLSFNKFKKSHCDSIILIETHKSTDPLDEFIISNYKFGNSISINKDGWVTVWYVVLPNRDWINAKEKATSNRIQDTNDTYYYIEDDKIYSYYKGEIEEISDIDIIVSSKAVSTSLTYKQYVNISNLYDCYINFCQQLLQDRGFSKCWNKNTLDSELIYKRDLVWMAINVIDYLVDRDNHPNQTLAEAQRIIELIHSCTGICPEQNETKSTTKYGCGCS